MSKKRILVIDDEDLIRTAMTAILEGNGYEVEEAESGEAGLEFVRAGRPDLIICDVNMGGMDGYHVLQELQKQPDTATIPFLFLTGYSDRDHFRHGMTLGADDYLLKPITQSELLMAVSQRLNKQSVLLAQGERKMDELRANISLALPHELRTPLHGILGFCGILQNEYASLTADDVKDLASRIKRAADRLQRLVENFLIYAQLEVVSSDERQVRELRSAETTDTLRLVELVARQRATHYRRPGDLAVLGFWRRGTGHGVFYVHRHLEAGLPGEAAAWDVNYLDSDW
jgi:CheY-like chemotaxis protein